MLFVEHQGARVAYKKDGHGPALVLIHGTGGDSESNWAAMVPKLSEEWTILRPDYAGSGATTDDGRDLTVDYLAGQVLAAIDDAGVDRFCLLGFSLGAAVAAQIAADHPDRVHALILLAGFQSATDARLQLQFTLWRDLINRDREALARLIMLTGFSPDAISALGADGVAQAIDDTLNTANWDGMARQVALDLTLDVQRAIARITSPTLIIGCTHDHMVPPSHAKALSAAIKDARYVELLSGHLAPMEQPDALAEIVAAFLKEQAA